MKTNDFILLLIVFGAIALIIFLYVKFVGATPKDSIAMFNGDVGCGKTSTGLSLTISSNAKKVKKVKFSNWIRKKLKKPLKEIPVVYSNLPLYNIKYKEFTLEHLQRKMRFEYNSNIFLNECSLVADSMLAYNIGKDDARKKVNDELKLFCKLIRHELKASGTCLVIDTQNPQDLALGFDRSISTTNIILDWINWVPFVRLVKIRQIKINIDNVNNNFETDTRNDNSKWLIVPKRIFKMYDTHCYEFLSRNLPISKELKYIRVTRRNRKKKTMQPFVIPTFNSCNEIVLSNAKIKWENKQKLTDEEYKVLKAYFMSELQKDDAKRLENFVKGVKENGKVE